MSNRYIVGDRDVRPWGSWEVVAAGAAYVVKRIIVSPGARLSLQRHKHREEHWTVIEGSGVVTIDVDRIQVMSGTSVYLPLGCVHRVENTAENDLVFIEIQRGDPLDENDIERLEDDYGRLKAPSVGAADIGSPHERARAL